MLLNYSFYIKRVQRFIEPYLHMHIGVINQEIFQNDHYSLFGGLLLSVVILGLSWYFITPYKLTPDVINRVNQKENVLSVQDYVDQSLLILKSNIDLLRLKRIEDQHFEFIVEKC